MAARCSCSKRCLTTSWSVFVWRCYRVQVWWLYMHTIAVHRRTEYQQVAPTKVRSLSLFPRRTPQATQKHRPCLHHTQPQQCPGSEKPEAWQKDLRGFTWCRLSSSYCCMRNPQLLTCICGDHCWMTCCLQVVRTDCWNRQSDRLVLVKHWAGRYTWCGPGHCGQIPLLREACAIKTRAGVSGHWSHWG